MNPRYRGVYIHGRVDRVRRGGKRVCVVAQPEEIISVHIPNWQIALPPSSWPAT